MGETGFYHSQEAIRCDGKLLASFSPRQIIALKVETVRSSLLGFVRVNAFKEILIRAKSLNQRSKNVIETSISICKVKEHHL